MLVNIPGNATIVDHNLLLVTREDLGKFIITYIARNQLSSHPY